MSAAETTALSHPELDEPALRVAERRLGGPVRLEVLRPRHVYRLSPRAAAKGSVVIKRLPFDRSHREQQALRHWLPQLGLEGFAAALLEIVPAAAEGFVWHVYEDLGNETLERARSGDRAATATRAATTLVSKLHVRFSAHPLLARGRLAGPELGAGLFARSVTDAARCLTALRESVAGDARGRAVVERLLERSTRLAREAAERNDAFVALAWPETLLHGDLWLGNFVMSRAGSLRLIDWERTGVGPAVYDLSTFLRQLPAADRPAVLTAYQEATLAAGWPWPSPALLERTAETCELARFASCLVWRVLPFLETRADAEQPPAWLIDDLVETERWFAERTPLFTADPDRSAA